MQPVTELVKQARAVEDGGVAQSSIQLALNEVLQFHQPSPSWRPQPAPTYADDQQFTLLQRLRLKLRDDFFDSLLIRPDEARRLRDRIPGARRPVVVVGDKGSGKSSVLLHCHYLLANEPPADEPEWQTPDVEGSHAIEYYDAFDLHSRLLSQDYDFCNLVYTDILDRYVLEAGRLWDWRLALIRRDDHFLPVREELVASGKALDEDNIRAWSDTAVFRECLRAFNSARGLPKLVQLTSFLSEQKGVRFIFLVDNLDQYTSKFQAQVIEHLIELMTSGGVWRSVAAVRYESYERARREIDEVMAEPFEVFELDERSMPFLLEFLHTRFEYLSSLQHSGFAGLPDPATVDSSERLTRIESAYASIIDDLAAANDPMPRDQTTTDTFDWYNGSLRSVAQSLVSLLAAVLERQDPLYPPNPSSEMLGPTSKHGNTRERRARRSLFYRHFILDSPFRLVEPAAPLVFSDLPESVNKLPFRDMHVLLLLRERTFTAKRSIGRTRSTMVADLERAMYPLNMDAYGVAESLRTLSAARGTDDRGLILLDSFDEIRPQHEIVVLRAAKFASRLLVPSCEYLFWSAMFMESGHELLPLTRPRRGRPKVMLPDAGLVKSETYRLQVASSFLAYITTEYSNWLESLAETKGEMWSAYNETFGGMSVFSDMRFGLRQFLRGASNDMADETYEGIQTDLAVAEGNVGTIAVLIGSPS